MKAEAVTRTDIMPLHRAHPIPQVESFPFGLSPEFLDSLKYHREHPETSVGEYRRLAIPSTYRQLRTGAEGR
jgi:hypothetical protein